MKRVFSALLFLVLTVCVVSVSFADEFSVRGSINFNSTKQDILDYEKSASSEIRENPTPNTLYNYYTDNCIACDGISYAGYDNCRVIYYFDSNDKLVSILYVVRFFGDSGERNIPDAYNRLDSALNDKYGISLDTPIAFTKSEKALNVYDFVKALNISGQLTDMKQRLADNKDYFIEIEIGKVEYMDWEAIEDRSKIDYADVRGVGISYSIIANEVVNELVQQAEDAQKALDSDL